MIVPGEAPIACLPMSKEVREDGRTEVVVLQQAAKLE